jgi:hypothetical protein
MKRARVIAALMVVSGAANAFDTGILVDASKSGPASWAC